MEKNLLSEKKLTKLVRNKGIKTWEDLLKFIRQIPYGRNSERGDFSLVIKENLGTCSSKHAFLKEIAVENDISEVKLILCLYKMTEGNTPGIGMNLTENEIKYIPEAHCYIRYGNERLDLTSKKSDLTRIESEIIEEKEITPKQIGQYKVDYHKDYLREWINEENIKFSFEELWLIREECIENLSKK